MTTYPIALALLHRYTFEVLDSSLGSLRSLLALLHNCIRVLRSCQFNNLVLMVFARRLQRCHDMGCALLVVYRRLRMVHALPLKHMVEVRLAARLYLNLLHVPST